MAAEAPPVAGATAASAEQATEVRLPPRVKMSWPVESQWTALLSEVTRVLYDCPSIHRTLGTSHSVHVRSLRNHRLHVFAPARLQSLEHERVPFDGKRRSWRQLMDSLLSHARTKGVRTRFEYT